MKTLEESTQTRRAQGIGTSGITQTHRKPLAVWLRGFPGRAFQLAAFGVSLAMADIFDGTTAAGR